MRSTALMVLVMFTSFALMAVANAQDDYDRDYEDGKGAGDYAGQGGGDYDGHGGRDYNGHGGGDYDDGDYGFGHGDDYDNIGFGRVGDEDLYADRDYEGGGHEH